MRLRIIPFLVLFLMQYARAQQPGNLRLNPNPALEVENEQATDPEINRVISIVNSVEEKQNFIDRFNSDSTAKLPLGIIKQVGQARYVIAVDSLKFKNNGAYFSAYAAIDFPGTGKKLAFKASNVKFNPAGVVGGEQARLYLASDHYIKINSSVSLKLSGSSRQNWVEWDCGGFKAINLVGHFVFRKNRLVPDPEATSDTVVTASFQIYTEDIHNFITGVSITPFKINGLSDWSFKVSNAIVDMSSLSNASFMAFPSGYQNPNMVTPQMWTGFALQSLKVKLPKEISRPGIPTELTVSNMLIDNMGLTGYFQAGNILPLNEGTMSGWDFSIDELGVGFTCNQLSGGHLKGKVQIPLTDSIQTLQYTADVYHNYTNSQTDFNFVLNPGSNVRFNVFSADVVLNKNSRLTVSKANGLLKPTACLSGLIAFNSRQLHSNNGQLAFQDLTITTDAPYVTNGIFSLHNVNGGQPKSNLYPVTINEISFGIHQNAPVLGFALHFNLTELLNNPASVGTSVLLKGKIEPWQKNYAGTVVTKTRWSFDRALINAIYVDVQTTPFTLKGSILYNDNTPGYGTGYFGSLDLSIAKIMEEPIGISAGFGSKDDFRYFFLDAKIPAKYVLPGSSIAISRIIGGVYYHMKPNKTSEADFIALNNNFNNVTGNALLYVPDKTISLGFKCGATGEFVFNEALCNGDFLLDVNFTNGGGLGQISLGGNAYSMASVSKRVNAPVKGKITMVFDAPSKTFDALAQVNIGYSNVITGTAYLKVHTDPQTWYVCVGRPSAPCNVRLLRLVDVPMYFMTGNYLEPCMQPPPAVSEQSQIANVISMRNETQLKNGKGFIAGGRIHAKIDKGMGGHSFNIKGKFDFDLGFDMMMKNYGENAVCGSPDEKVGMNGYQLAGDMFLAMYGHVNISGHFKFPGDCPNSYKLCAFGKCCCDFTVGCLVDTDFSKKIFEADVTASVSANVPKPLYFDGKVNCTYNLFDRASGNFDFNYDYGEYCVLPPN